MRRNIPAGLGCAVVFGVVAWACDGGLDPEEGEESFSPGALTACIASGTDADINKVFASATPGAEAVLCPRAVFSLGNQIRFTAANQKLYTQGLPTDGSAATLRVTGSGVTTAIFAHDLPGITIRNIRVDGNRPGLGWVSGGGALLELGGKAAGHIIQNIVAFEPRGWSVLHLFEGATPNNVPQCQNATITNNVLGPAGTPDGRWADGISLACGNSLVENNRITDATDGAIVIFGAPGSTIRNNTIIADTRQLLGGINMVDFNATFGQGNYTGTLVTGNVIEGRGEFIKIGIAMGPQIWWCNSNTNYGGTVTNNTIKGLNVGYGYAVNGVTNWTVTGNVDTARHVGKVTSGCGGTPTAPGAFQRQNSSGTFQAGFQPATLRFLLNVSEPAILRVGQTPTGCSDFLPNWRLLPGQTFSSCDGRFLLALQGDGNLVLYQGSTPLWASNTAGRRVAQALMQNDGNFAVYDTAGTAIWSSGTVNHPGAHLAVQNDGNLVIYSSAGSVLWASNTCCH